MKPVKRIRKTVLSVIMVLFFTEYLMALPSGMWHDGDFLFYTNV
ncbi:MAG: hypothetical protein U0Y08_05915 [Bacteroidia bacterium]